MTEPTKEAGTKARASRTLLTIPPATTRQLAWFVLRLVITYTLVAMAIQALSPLIDILIARGARNLLAFVSSPYYLQTIEFYEEGYGVTTWIGPLRDGFKLPSLMFVFAFSIGYVIALPGFFGWKYWVRAAAVILISYFVCALSVAIVADARLIASFHQLGIELQPAWRANTSSFLQHYLWMLTVRLYPLVMVIGLTLESGAFRAAAPGSSRALRVLRGSVAGALALLLAVVLGFDSTANERIARVEHESISKRVEGLEALNPDLGTGLVNLAEFLLKQRNQRAALNVYRIAFDHLDGPARRKAIESYDRIHEAVMQQMLDDAKRRREQRNAQLE